MSALSATDPITVQPEAMATLAKAARVDIDVPPVAPRGTAA